MFTNEQAALNDSLSITHIILITFKQPLCSAGRELITPPAAPSMEIDGDTSNYDFYEEDDSEVVNNLSATQRDDFILFDSIIGKMNPAC